MLFVRIRTPKNCCEEGPFVISLLPTEANAAKGYRQNHNFPQPRPYSNRNVGMARSERLVESGGRAGVF
jgi:hypothetical protein